MTNFKSILKCFLIISAAVLLISNINVNAEDFQRPIVVNGDKVEYSPDHKKVSAEGNVLIIYEDSTLTCDKITVDITTKDALAQGNVRLENQGDIIEAEEARYNFNSKLGVILKAKVYSEPHYGRGEEIERVEEDRLDVKGGYITTCDLDIPHYRITSKTAEIYPGDKVKISNATVKVGKLPVFYMPRYVHSLKDPFMHVRFSPGKSKDWGPYLLSAWRFNLTKYARGRMYLDYRDRIGVSEGFGFNYDPPGLGRGDFKYYYTQERTRGLKQTKAAEFQRYFVRWRHMWDIDEKTKLTSEAYKIVDSKRMILGSGHNVLKDFFFREYEKDSAPPTYILLSKLYKYANLNLLVRKRINSWMGRTEKLPELTISLPKYKIGKRIALYFKNDMKFSNLNSKTASPSDQDSDVVRYDMYNEATVLSKLFFLRVSPYIGMRDTFYSKDKFGDSVQPREIFYSGVDISTKFYRIFNVNTNFLNLAINGLRHIITPTVKYGFVNTPTIPSSRLQQFDEIDAIKRSNTASVEIVNKLQTKRDNNTVDIATLTISTTFDFLKTRTSSGSGDYLFDLELIPYAWLRFEADANYDPNEDYFKIANFDVVANFAKERSLGFGHRYERGGGKEFTSQLIWRLNPKWKFSIYQRYQFAGVSAGYVKGLREQQYGITRDLHCWEVDFNYNVDRVKGESIWVIFRLKAFPELEFDFDQTYHQPKSGSQSERLR